jgi:hypothetical protein
MAQFNLMELQFTLNVGARGAQSTSVSAAKAAMERIAGTGSAPARNLDITIEVQEPESRAAMPKHRCTTCASYPDARYYPDLRLMTWHPAGVLTDAAADQAVEFVDNREKMDGEVFDRYLDVTGYTEIQLGLDHIVWLARQRRRYRGKSVRTAFYALRVIGVKIAKMYEELMQGSHIEVRTFRDRSIAADWLGVPMEVLLPKRTAAPTSV